jgi:hypothetical protein
MVGGRSQRNVLERADIRSSALRSHDAIKIMTVRQYGWISRINGWAMEFEMEIVIGRIGEQWIARCVGSPSNIGARCYKVVVICASQG